MGEWRQETLGEDYILLNVLDAEEIALLKGLWPSGAGDTSDKTAWDAAIDGISTDLVSYYRDHEDGTPTGKWLANDNS